LLYIVQVCNSVGECHCKKGYAPPDCTDSGCGGSYHGGSPTPGCVNTLDQGCTCFFIFS